MYKKSETRSVPRKMGLDTRFRNELSISHFLKCRFLSPRAHEANFTRTILGVFSRLTKKVGRLFGLNVFSFEINRNEGKIPSEKRQQSPPRTFLKRRFLGPSACYANLARAIRGSLPHLRKKPGGFFRANRAQLRVIGC